MHNYLPLVFIASLVLLLPCFFLLPKPVWTFQGTPSRLSSAAQILLGLYLPFGLTAGVIIGIGFASPMLEFIAFAAAILLAMYTRQSNEHAMPFMLATHFAASIALCAVLQEWRCAVYFVDGVPSRIEQAVTCDGTTVSALDLTASYRVYPPPGFVSAER